MFESGKSTTVSAAILFPAVCRDTKKAGNVWQNYQNTLWAKLLLFFMSKEWASVAASWGAQIEIRNLLLYKILMEKPNDCAYGNIGTFSWLKATSSGQLVYLLQVPFNGGFVSESELDLNDIFDFKKILKQEWLLAF